MVDESVSRISLIEGVSEDFVDPADDGLLEGLFIISLPESPPAWEVGRDTLASWMSPLLPFTVDWSTQSRALFFFCRESALIASLAATTAAAPDAFPVAFDFSNKSTFPSLVDTTNSGMSMSETMLSDEDVVDEAPLEGRLLPLGALFLEEDASLTSSCESDKVGTSTGWLKERYEMGPAFNFSNHNNRRKVLSYTLTNPSAPPVTMCLLATDSMCVMAALCSLFELCGLIRERNNHSPRLL